MANNAPGRNLSFLELNGKAVLTSALYAESGGISRTVGVNRRLHSQPAITGLMAMLHTNLVSLPDQRQGTQILFELAGQPFPVRLFAHRSAVLRTPPLARLFLRASAALRCVNLEVLMGRQAHTSHVHWIQD